MAHANVICCARYGFALLVAAAITVPSAVSADTTTTIGGSVPATLSLSLGAPPAFGNFTPGVAKDYTASTTATVITTGGDAALTVQDTASTAPGHLVNGTFSLPAALQASASSAGGTSAGLQTVSATAVSLLTWSGPATNDSVTLGFKQTIGSSDALRTGTYSKTLTYTLSSTTP